MARVGDDLDPAVREGIAHGDGLLKGPEGIVRGDEDKNRRLNYSLLRGRYDRRLICLHALS
jgi:hypothetical protein